MGAYVVHFEPDPFIEMDDLNLGLVDLYYLYPGIYTLKIWHTKCLLYHIVKEIIEQ